jgi:hypothetical protein
MAGNQVETRVRLTAEGMAEVIQAFERVSKAGQKSAKETETAFAAVNKQFSELGRTLLGGLGLVLIAEKFKELFKGALESAEGLTRLSAQTGLSTDAIQALGRAARETGLSVDVANAGVAKFTISMGKAEIGGKLTANALAQLGLSIGDIKKSTPDQQLLAIANALARIPEAAKRSQIEVAIFGKAGAQLDQALIKLGTDGIDGLLGRMKALGVYMDRDSINQLKHTAETMRDVGDEATGLGRQFLIGLLPGVQGAMDGILTATTSKGVPAMKQLGEWAGWAIKVIVSGFLTAGKVIGVFFDQYAESYNKIKTGDFTDKLRGFWGLTGPGAIAGAVKKIRTEQFQDELGKALAAIWSPGEKPGTPKPGEGPPGGAGGVTAADVAIAQAKYKLLAQLKDNELALFLVQSKLQMDIDTEQYKQGAITLQDYYAKRAAIIASEYDKRIAITRQKAAAEARVPVADSDIGTQALARQTAQAKLQGQIDDAQAKRAEALQANLNAEAAAQTALDQRTIAAQERLLTLEGKKYDAARLRLASDLLALDLELRQGGVGDTKRGGIEGEFAQQGAAKIGFDEKAQQANATLSELATKTKEVQDLVRDGQIFSIDGQQRILELDRERLPLLQQQAAAMLVLAKESGDPTAIANAEAFSEKINAITVSTNEAGVAMAQLKLGVEGAVGKGINTFLTDALSGTKNLKQTFRDTALSIVSDLEKIAQKALEEAILKQIFGAASGGAATGSFLSIAFSAIAAGGAGGGLIRGPGTSTSDSIPLLASDREYIVNADATAQPGVLPLLEALNGGKLRGTAGTGVPKFATGGLVTGGAAAPVIKLVNVLDPTTVGDHLQTAAGEQAVLNIIAKNPSRIRNAIQ